MRRSTKKAEQADSLPQQEEGIEYIAKEMGIEFSKIILFTESRSGFENRTRKEWNKMLLAIDQSKEPCSILCRDTSRLSRNPTDNLEIANRIF
jgi:DNA invertase Pin-like site-specific DNA recombinase